MDIILSQSLQQSEFLLEKHSKEFFNKNVIYYNPHLKRLEARERKPGDSRIENEENVSRYILDFFQVQKNKPLYDAQLHNLHKNVSRIESLFSASKKSGKRKSDETHSLTDALKDYLKKLHYTLLPDATGKERVYSEGVLLEARNETRIIMGDKEFNIPSALIQQTLIPRFGSRVIILPDNTPHHKFGNQLLQKFLEDPTENIPKCDPIVLFDAIVYFLNYGFSKIALHYFEIYQKQNATSDRLLELVDILKSAQNCLAHDIAKQCQTFIINHVTRVLFFTRLTAEQKKVYKENFSNDFIDKISAKCKQLGVNLDLDRFFPEYGSEPIFARLPVVLGAPAAPPVPAAALHHGVPVLAPNGVNFLPAGLGPVAFHMGHGVHGVPPRNNPVNAPVRPILINDTLRIDRSDFTSLYQVFPQSTRQIFSSNMLSQKLKGNMFPSGPNPILPECLKEFFKTITILNLDFQDRHIVEYCTNLKHLILHSLFSIEYLILPNTLEIINCYEFPSKKFLDEFLDRYSKLKEVKIEREVPKTHEQSLLRRGFVKLEGRTYRRKMI
jgi:hypothetical protein